MIVYYSEGKFKMTRFKAVLSFYVEPRTLP